MFKNVLRGLSVILGMMVIFGCASMKDIEVQRYVDVRDRVDQDMETGNAGFVGGTPQPEDRSGIRTTRKIYVLEVSKTGELGEENVIVETPAGTTDEDADVQDEESYEEEQEEYLIPPKESRVTQDEVAAEEDYRSAPVEQTAPSSSVEYTIQKDDTLQKISKKFYDSFSKWPRIYDANRDVLDSPDKIQPGTVIRIPMD